MQHTFDPRLEQLLNSKIHCDIVFVAGTGPSLAAIDVSLIDKDRHVVIACNNAYKAFPNGVTIGHHSDYAWWSANAKQVSGDFNGQLLSTAALGHSNPIYPDQVLKLAYSNRAVFGGNWGDLSGVNSGQQALIMAHWFMPRSIVLLGIDHHRSANGQAHWTNDPTPDEQGHQEKMWQGAMKWWDRFLRDRPLEWGSMGFTTPLPEVINASPTSALTQFPKIDGLDALILR